MNDTQHLDKDALRVQLQARNVMKREMLFFYALLIAGMLLFFLVGLRSIWGIVAFLLFVIAFRTATVWYQWNFLIQGLNHYLG